jgi:hypothetical protein
VDGFGVLMDPPAGFKHENNCIALSWLNTSRRRIHNRAPVPSTALTFYGPGVHAKTTAGTTSRAQPVSSVKELLLYCLSARKKK